MAIQGANVFRGYENNPEANTRAFSDGWFRTGDEGMLDEDCYLHLTGRIKDIIIRGGENIAPHEVDEVLLQHTGVAAAVTFGYVHPTLGEEVAAAVVLQEGPSSQASENGAHQALPRAFGGLQVSEENLSGEKHSHHLDGKNPAARGGGYACE